MVLGGVLSVLLVETLFNLYSRGLHHRSDIDSSHLFCPFREEGRKDVLLNEEQGTT
jgi:hypothetical protein